jgi:hypothetical protein
LKNGGTGSGAARPLLIGSGLQREKKWRCKIPCRRKSSHEQERMRHPGPVCCWVWHCFLIAAIAACGKDRPHDTGAKGTLELDINTVAELHTPHSTMVVAPSVRHAANHPSAQTAPRKAGDGGGI